MNNDDYNWLLILLITFLIFLSSQCYDQQSERYHQLSTKKYHFIF